MSEFAGSDEFAAEIHAVFAQPVTYVPLSGPSQPIHAVYSNNPAPGFMGEGATLRTITWEVLQADVAKPAKGDKIVGGVELPARLRGEWLVIDITARDDVAAHDLIVERVGG